MSHTPDNSSSKFAFDPRTSEFPRDTSVTLPEYLKRNDLEGLAPQEIVYLYSSAIQVHPQSGSVMIQRTYRLEPGDREEPSSNYELTSKVPVKRVYETSPNGELLDGFIIDGRKITPGGLYTLPPAYLDYEEATSWKGEHPEYVPILGAIFTDPDGNIDPRGETTIYPALDVFARQIDVLADRLEMTVPGNPAALGAAATSAETLSIENE